MRIAAIRWLRAILELARAFAATKSESCKTESQKYNASGFWDCARWAYCNVDWPVQPRDQRGVDGSPRGGVFAHGASDIVHDKQVRAGHRNAKRELQPHRGFHCADRDHIWIVAGGGDCAVTIGARAVVAALIASGNYDY